MSILGNRVLRKEDPKFLTTGGTYLDDLDLPGALFLTYVRSTMAHAEIRSVDVEEVKRAPGVVAVLTAEDIDLEPAAPRSITDPKMTRPWLAQDRVRFVGDPIVAILTEERYQGPDAAELAFIDYDPLPAVVTVTDAKKDETLLFPEAGTNACLTFPARGGEMFDGCEVIVTQRIVNQRVAPCPLEVRGSAAVWGDDGRLTYWTSSQHAHGVKSALIDRFGFDEEQLRVVTPDVGGGFGAKIGGDTDELLIAWIARKLGRAVRWTETRSESMLGMGHGRAQQQLVELGGTRDGRISAYRLTVEQDAGAYPNMGAVLPYMTRTMLTGVYDIPKADFSSVSYVTNTTPTVAYRGAGRPEATAAIERTIDVYARQIGMDPVEVRRRNLIAKDAFPYKTPSGTVYDCGDYEGALDRAVAGAGYEELRREQERRRDAGDVMQLGIGVSVYVEITAGPSAPKEFGAVEVKADGKVVVRTGSSSHGQGHHTAFAMIVADQLGVSIDDVEVIHGDTDVIPRGEGTMGSRSLQAGGTAVSRATGQVVERAKDLAADLLEAATEDLVLDREAGKWHVAGTPAISKSWAEVAASAGEGGLQAEVDYEGSGPTFPFGAHIALVEVDTETGKVRLLRLIACDDAGKILNPLLADGQVHGGLAQGAAQALLEEVRYDEDGNPITSNLADYAFITAAELPSFERIQMETPTPVNELGAKGIGESGTIGSTPAVHNAVIDALSHLGVSHMDMPCTPQRVWTAINGGAGS